MGTSTVTAFLNLLPYVSQGVAAITAISSLVESIAESLKQTDMWTEEAETAWQQYLLAKAQEPQYQPDPTLPEIGK